MLVRVAEGEGTRLIAAGMDIAPSTARTHVQRVLMKLGVGSRLEAAALAARTGLLERAAANGGAPQGPYAPEGARGTHQGDTPGGTRQGPYVPGQRG